MVVDSSALLAILLQEPEAQAISEAIEIDPTRLISAMSVLEIGMVLDFRKGPAGERELEILLHRAGIEVVSLDADLVQLAREAYAKFGKDRHPARLNLGDCCSYALSRHSGQPLLFKGDDFSKTDVAVVLY